MLYGPAAEVSAWNSVAPRASIARSTAGAAAGRIGGTARGLPRPALVNPAGCKSAPAVSVRLPVWTASATMMATSAECPYLAVDCQRLSSRSVL